MSLDDAISVHAHWRRRLEFYLASPDRSIDPETVADANQCELGQWMTAHEAAYAGDPAFRELAAAHTAFHQAAADVVARANAGAHVRSEVLLGSGSDYSRRSSAVIHAIMRIRARARR